jgi:hypothetical protein
MDMTAALLVYTRRLVSHVDGSGKVSKNHSWNTGENLQVLRSITPSFGGLISLHWQDFIRKYLASLVVICPPNPFKYGLQLPTLLLRREIGALLIGYLPTQPF